MFFSTCVLTVCFVFGVGIMSGTTVRTVLVSTLCVADFRISSRSAGVAVAAALALGLVEAEAEDGGVDTVETRSDSWDAGVIGVAVFREFENTHVGRRFYIDDLVTDESERSTGAGHTLIAYLEKVARDRGCPGLDLESGTHRTRAHRFYFREGFFITAFSFRKEFQ